MAYRGGRIEMVKEMRVVRHTLTINWTKGTDTAWNASREMARELGFSANGCQAAIPSHGYDADAQSHAAPGPT